MDEPIVACYDGEIVEYHDGKCDQEKLRQGKTLCEGGYGGFGKAIIFKMDKGDPKTGVQYALYAHLEERLPVGTKVNAGEKIGTVGLTGNTTGVHLHFELGTEATWGSTYFGL